MTADPSSGTIPTGYLVSSVGTGDVKRHAGGYVWEIQIGSNASSRIGFYGVTPVLQPSGADQAAVTLATSQMTAPAGTAKTTARQSTISVRSMIDV